MHMRQMNLRVLITGLALIVLAVGFFLYMLTLAPKSNDPAALMQTVGMVSGAVGALGLVLALFGAIGRRRR
jgi:uncharacterized protein (TIGR03382 family)